MNLVEIYKIYKTEQKYRHLLRNEALKMIRLNMPITSRYKLARKNIEKLNKVKRKFKRTLSSHI